jgi:hypothetical protein
MVHGEVGAVNARARAKHALEVFGTHEAIDHGAAAGVSATAARTARRSRRSDGQALAALGATRVDHGTTASRLHSHEEAVGAGAADFGGLVGAFHDLLGPYRLDSLQKLWLPRCPVGNSLWGLLDLCAELRRRDVGRCGRFGRPPHLLSIALRETQY